MNYEKRVREAVLEHFPKATCSVHFINASKLLAQANVRRARSKRLTFASQTIMSEEGWIGLVWLRDYYQFLQDEHGSFHESILEENVRGYLQKTSVNERIGLTLKNSDAAEFWLLNNGITILADELKPSSSGLTIIDPQIVNGMQTSRQIFDYYQTISGDLYKSGNTGEDKRRVLIRVIETKDASIRDQITRATNSQNQMPAEALRATDQIHRNIEELFWQFGLFYDRRKGYYKDQGKPAAQIVSVRSVLQAMLAIPLRRPDDARARPTDYLNDDDKYLTVFSPDGYNLNVYLKCIQLVRKIEGFEHKKISDFKDCRLNLQFYAALVSACRLVGNAHVPAKDLAKLDLSLLTDDLMSSCYDFAYSTYLKFGQDDKAAKGSDMREEIVKLLEAEIHGE